MDALLSYLSELQRSELKKKLVLDFPSFFFADVLFRTHLIQNDVDVGEAQPIHQCFYRVLFTAVPSCSSWASPCLLVKKPDSTYRFCTDYRKLNAITKPDAFPLPRIEECVDQVDAGNFLTKLDLLKGY